MEVPSVAQQALPGFEGEDKGAAGSRYIHAGKQVLYGTEQYCDAVSSDAAVSIAAAMNAADLQHDWAKLISQVR